MARERQYLNKQGNSNSQGGNQTSNSQANHHINTNTSSGQLTTAGNHSKKNSQSNIFSYRKSPQSQLNEIVHQNRNQQSLGQKGIELRYQKDIQLLQQQQQQQQQQPQYQSQFLNQNQFMQLQQQEGIHQAVLHQHHHDKNSAKGDVIGKIQNGLKDFKQLIQNVENVDRESNLSKEQQQHIMQSQQISKQQTQLSQLNPGQTNTTIQKRINSPVSPISGQNISHRQSVAGNAIEDLKRAMVQQGYQQQQMYQSQYLEQDSYQQHMHNQQIQSNLVTQNSSSSHNNHLNSNSYNPNENISLLANKLSEIVQNFSSPSKKINTVASTTTTIPPSAMKNSNIMIGNSNNQPFTTSIQSSRHASGNLYAGTSQIGSSIAHQQPISQQQSAQNKLQIGSSNQNSLKYSQILNSNSINGYMRQQNANQASPQQQIQSKIQFQQEQQNQHSSPARYIQSIQANNNKPSYSIGATAINSAASGNGVGGANTQKKFNQQVQQMQGKQSGNIQVGQDLQNNHTITNQETRPFITDRVYNQKDTQYLLQHGQSNSTRIQVTDGSKQQQRKGAFNNNLNKKKRNEIKEYRHFSSIDFKNSEQNSLLGNIPTSNNNNNNHNNVYQNNSMAVGSNVSQIRNINSAVQNNYLNQVNSISATNTSRQQKNPSNQFVVSSAIPLMSVQQKNQLMQAINSLPGNQTLPHHSSSLSNINSSLLQDKQTLPQDSQQFKHIAPNSSAQSTVANAATLISQMGINKQQMYPNNVQDGGNAKSMSNSFNKQTPSAQQMLQKLENSPIANISNRLANSNRSNTSRPQQTIVSNQASPQPQLNLNTQAAQNYNNIQQQINSAKSASGNGGISSKSGNKHSLSVLQPSHSPDHQYQNAVQQNSGRIQSATNFINNTSLQNKPIANLHNSNNSMQNNYLISQRSTKANNAISSQMVSNINNTNNNNNTTINNSVINGSNSFGKLFGNLSLMNNNNNNNSIVVNNTNSTIGQGSNSNNTLNSQNVIKNSNSALNIKIQKQLQQQQQQAQLTSQVAAFKKSGGSTFVGSNQQPTSVKSGEKQIKERRKHSESTATHSHSVNNSNLMMITNLSQQKYFEEDMAKEQPSHSFQKNLQGVSLKSSLIYPSNISSTNNNNNPINKQSIQQSLLNDTEKSQQQSQFDKIKQLQQRLQFGGNIISSSKTPDRDRNTSSALSQRKFELLNQSRTPLDRMSQLQSHNYSPSTMTLDISQHKDLIKNNSKMLLDGKQKSIVPENNSQIQKNQANSNNITNQNNHNNLLPNMLQDMKGKMYGQQEGGDDLEIDNIQEDYQFTLQNPEQLNNEVHKHYSNISLPLPLEILQQDNKNINNGSSNQEFSHHLNKIEQLNSKNLQNQQNILSTQLLLQQQQQQQNTNKKKNVPTYLNKNPNQINYSVNTSQITHKSNQISDQSTHNVHNPHLQQQLSESNTLGSSEVSKSNNSHQSFINPTNNSFYNQIKLQTIDSMFIPHPSQVLNTGMTADKASGQGGYANQQHDESMGDYREYADQSAVQIGGLLANSQYNNNSNFRGVSPSNYQNQENIDYSQSIKEQMDQISEYNQQQLPSAYIQQNYEQMLPPNSIYQDNINMDYLDISQKQQHQQQQLHNFENQDANLWREANYKQQEQDLKQLEHIYGRQQQQQQSSQPNISQNNTANKYQQKNNYLTKNTKNLKQQLEELNNNQHPLLVNMISADKGTDEKGKRKSTQISEGSDKKRTQTPQNHPHKLNQQHHTLSSTNKGSNHFRLPNDEADNSINSSAKKVKKPLPKQSPTSSSKYNGKPPNFQAYEPSINKNYPQTQFQQQQQIQSSQNTGQKGSPQPLSSQITAKFNQQQNIQEFKLNDLINDMEGQQNLDMITGDDDNFQFQNETLPIEDQFQELQNQKFIANQELPEFNSKQYASDSNSQSNYQNTSSFYHNKSQIEEQLVKLNEIGKKIDHLSQDQEIQQFIQADDQIQLEAELMQTLFDHKHKINAIVYNYQDDIIFTASHDYTLKAFAQVSNESTQYECVESIRHKRWVTSLEYISSHRLLLSGGADGMIKLFKLSDSPLERINEGNNNQIEQNNNLLSINSFIKAHSSTITGLKYLKNEDHALLSCGTDGMIHLWDLETLKIKQQWNIESQISAIEWIPSSSQLLNINQHNLQIFDIRQNGLVSQIQNSDFTCVKSLPNQDYSYLVGTGQYYNPQVPGQVQQQSSFSASLLLFDQRKSLTNPTTIFRPFNGSQIKCIETYEDQNTCIYGTDQSIECINLGTHNGYILDSQVPSVSCLAMDQNRIISGSKKNDLRIYNVL